MARQNISQGLSLYMNSQTPSNVVSNEITPNATPALTGARQNPGPGDAPAPAQILIIDEGYDQDLQDLDKPEEIAFDEAKETIKS